MILKAQMQTVGARQLFVAHAGTTLTVTGY